MTRRRTSTVPPAVRRRRVLVAAVWSWPPPVPAGAGRRRSRRRPRRAPATVLGRRRSPTHGARGRLPRGRAGEVAEVAADLARRAGRRERLGGHTGARHRRRPDRSLQWRWTPSAIPDLAPGHARRRGPDGGGRRHRRVRVAPRPGRSRPLRPGRGLRSGRRPPRSARQRLRRPERARHARRGADRRDRRQRHRHRRAECGARSCRSACSAPTAPARRRASPPGIIHAVDNGAVGHQPQPRRPLQLRPGRPPSVRHRRTTSWSSPPPATTGSTATSVNYPGASPGAISVAALDEDGRLGLLQLQRRRPTSITAPGTLGGLDRQQRAVPTTP